MEFLRKHYEKLLLSVVLAGLIGAVFFMLKRIADEREFLDGKRKGITEKMNPYKALNTSAYDSALQRTKTFHPIILHGQHNTFNPVLWQRKPDGALLKVVTGKEIGPTAAMVTDISPLYYILDLERVSGSSYQVSVIREALPNPADRIKRSRYVSLTSPKTEFFRLKEVKGPADNPTELVFELADTQETVSIAKDKPFKRVDGYTCDIEYPLENQKFAKLRQGDEVAFGGEEYTVDIKPDEVVLSAKSSTKRTSLKYSAKKE